MSDGRSPWNALELKVPPLLVVVVFAASMKVVAVAWPSGAVTFTGQKALAMACVVVGAWITAAGVLAFRRAGTTVDPTRPQATSQIVSSGPYRFTRNPMYLGFALALIGWAVWLGHAAGLLLVALWVVYLDRFQIRPEERMLAERFGEPYRAYCARVRRWL